MDIKEFQSEDAEALSRLIVRTLRTVSSQEYSQGAIEALIPFFTTSKLIETGASQYMIVCVDDDELVGVASLDRDRVRNVFVSSDMQRRGIGRMLMAKIRGYSAGGRREKAIPSLGDVSAKFLRSHGLHAKGTDRSRAQWFSDTRDRDGKASVRRPSCLVKRHETNRAACSSGIGAC